jgi:hypothetical protein
VYVGVTKISQVREERAMPYKLFRCIFLYHAFCHKNQCVIDMQEMNALYDNNTRLMDFLMALNHNIET